MSGSAGVSHHSPEPSGYLLFSATRRLIVVKGLLARRAVETLITSGTVIKRQIRASLWTLQIYRIGENVFGWDSLE